MSAGGLTERRLLDLLAEGDPAAPALVGLGGARMSRGEVWAAAARVAGVVARAVPEGGAVAVLLPQTPEGIAGVLGAVAAGRVVLVLSPNDPPGRVAAILAEGGAAALLTEGEAPQGVVRIGLAAALAGDEGWAPEGRHDPDAAAVVHFTSGSTGVPKGIVLSLRCVLHRAGLTMRSLALGAGDAVFAASLPAMGSGLSFPVATLLAGGRFLAANLAQAGALAVLGLMRAEGATVAIAGPAILRTLLRLPPAEGAFAGVRMLRIGAAGMLQADLDAIRAVVPAGCGISHTYASTEALLAAEWVVPRDFVAEGAVVPVGYPTGDHDFALVGEDGAPVGAGEVGEYVAAARHMALGEWVGGRVVEGRMRPDPARPGWRVFHSGDLMRLGADGLLRFAGRVDRQIKINGVRIEPAEIEAVLRSVPGVADAAVVAVEAAGLVRLVAFIAADEAVLEMARAAVSARLGQAMRPARIVAVAALPRLPGGKTDLAALRTRAAG